MRYLSYLFHLLVAVVSVSADLGEMWKITETTFDFANLEFTLRYKISDQIQRNQIAYSIYDSKDCSNGGKQMKYLGFPYLESAMAVNQKANNNQEIVLKIGIDFATIQQAPIFYEAKDGKGDAEIQFCVRLALLSNDVASPQAVEANFVESPVKLEVELHDGIFVHLPFEINFRGLSDKIYDTNGGNLRGGSRHSG